MRMRKKKHSAERLDACGKYLLNAESLMEDPSAIIGMDGAPVFLEIGAGKGGFACGMAQRHSDTAYFAMEKVTDCVVLAAEKANSGEYGELTNLRFIIDTADNLMRIFDRGTVDTVFLNFSDPWPKKGYAKRRLTHRKYLAVYMNLLKDGGALRFKTDNVGLFDFSLEEIEAMGLVPEIVTRDLHASEWNEGNIMTEYERNFSEQGVKINMLVLRKPAGFNPDVLPEFTLENKHYETADR
jgi:tRNA (guanine-N7-)-methyltransferase